jgi:hypothetical protein
MAFMAATRTACGPVLEAMNSAGSDALSARLPSVWITRMRLSAGNCDNDSVNAVVIAASGRSRAVWQAAANST